MSAAGPPGAPELVSDPGPAEEAAILAILVAHNEAAAGPANKRALALVVRDAAGAVAGGLWGATAYRWLFVQYLALRPELRGQGHGRALLLAAEAEARARGCVGVWLDTYSFQARGFYEALGYAEFGVIPDHPPGARRHFLLKRISP